MFDPERRIEVEWDRPVGQAPYTVRLAVQVEDQARACWPRISAKVAGMNTNIRSMEGHRRRSPGRIDMTVEIRDLKHLEKVIKSVKTVSGVLDVERVYR